MKKILFTFCTLILISSCSENSDTMKNLKDSESFLSMNAVKEGVNQIEPGLQYQIINSGSPDSLQLQSDNLVTAHFHGTLSDGSVFWSSVDSNEPLKTNLSQLIVGCQKAMSLMRVGDKWRVFIHPSLAYGEQGRSGIPANSALIFEIEILDAV
jgi:FKBP-type peptidyl-prolyl cis-trans isomerase